jgi:UDP-N-acetylmuramate--alanine ligase
MVYLGRTRRIHFVGIGGIGMSGIAEVLLNLGFGVSGSDLKRTDITEKLERLGARISYSHEPVNVAGSDVVVYSSAVTATNPELVEAKKHAVPTIRRAEMLAELMRLKFAVTVGGSHGKTTTTSIIASVLAEGGLDPTIVVGGKLRSSSSNVRLGSSRYMVAEADESDGSFVQLPSSIVVITNIDLEHLDYYPDLEAIKDHFVEYAARVPFYGSVVLCVDDENVRSILPRIRKRKVTYALWEPADLTGIIVDRSDTGARFGVLHQNKPLGEVRINLPGDHYVQNALAAVAVGMELDVPFEAIKKGIESFEGVGRRFEIKGTARGVTVIDDYGHHPTEIAATIRAARRNLKKRVFVLFQPHRYTRTQALAEQFGRCFEEAEAVYVTDIYAASEAPIPGVTSENLVSVIARAGRVDVHYAASFADMVEAVANRAGSGDVVLTLGAGDIYKAGELLLERLGRGG